MCDVSTMHCTSRCMNKNRQTTHSDAHFYPRTMEAISIPSKDRHMLANVFIHVLYVTQLLSSLCLWDVCKITNSLLVWGSEVTSQGKPSCVFAVYHSLSGVTIRSQKIKPNKCGGHHGGPKKKKIHGWFAQPACTFRIKWKGNSREKEEGRRKKGRDVFLFSVPLCSCRRKTGVRGLAKGGKKKGDAWVCVSKGQSVLLGQIPPYWS